MRWSSGKEGILLVWFERALEVQIKEAFQRRNLCWTVSMSDQLLPVRFAVHGSEEFNMGIDNFPPRFFIRFE